VLTEVTASAPHHLVADAALTGGRFEVIRHADRRPEAAREGGARARPLRLALSPRR
jgi:hypothetical protein